MMKKMYLIIIGAALIASILYINYYPRERVMDVSWTYAYKDINEMTEKADLVIVGKAISSISYRESADPFTSIWTDYTVRGDKVIKGKVDEPNIILHQTGGKIGSETQYIRDDPLIEEGTTMLLFLKQYEPNKYYILGGPQGRFVVEQGKVYSIGELYAPASATTIRLHTKGIALENFLSNFFK